MGEEKSSMRTVIYSFGGTPTVGDLVMISCQSRRGGASSAKCVIGEKDTYVVPGTNLHRNFRAAETIEDIARVLAEDINGQTSEWSPGTGDFRAVAKGNRLTVMASQLMDDVTFHCDVEGLKTETCEIDVL